MLRSNKSKLDFMLFKQKAVYILIIVSILVLFFYMLIFRHSDVVSRTIIKGKLITGDLNMARSAFQNCVVELENKTIVVAHCANGNNKRDDLVKIIMVRNKNGTDYYNVCDSYTLCE